ncbi:MAG TPA: hypothetical protein VGJ39_11145 [Vicinamibacterales bacterium]
MPLPTSSPIPLPGSSPIPIPGTSSFDGLLMSSGSSRKLPFLLEFDCGVVPFGTLSVIVDTADRRGTENMVQATVSITN